MISVDKRIIRFCILALFLLIAYSSPLAFASIDLWSQTIIHILSLLIACLLIADSYASKAFSFDVSYWIPIGAWLIFIAISTFLAANKFVAYTELMNTLNCVFLFYLSVNVKLWFDEIGTLLRWWGYIVVILGILIIYQYATEPTHPTFGEFSSMVNPNIFASYLLFWIPVWCYWLIQSSRSREYRNGVVFLIVTLISVAALVLTHSFVSYFAMLMAFVIVQWRTIARLFRRYLWPVIAILCVLLIIIGVACVREKKLVSVFQRLVWWESTAHMIMRNPWFGIGPGGYADAYEYFKIDSAMYRTLVKRKIILEDSQNDKRVPNTLYAHNIILQMIAENGIFCTLLFLVVFVKLLRRIFRNADQNPLAWALLFGACAFLMKDMIDFSFFVPAISYIFWIWMGLLVALTPLPAERTMVTLYSKSSRPIMLLLVLTLAPFIARPFLISRDVAMAKYARLHGDAERAESLLQNLRNKNYSFPEIYFESAQLYHDKFSQTHNAVPLNMAKQYAQDAVARSPYNRRYHVFLSSLESIH